MQFIITNHPERISQKHSSDLFHVICSCGSRMKFENDDDFGASFYACQSCSASWHVPLHGAVEKVGTNHSSYYTGQIMVGYGGHPLLFDYAIDVSNTMGALIRVSKKEYDALNSGDYIYFKSPQ